VLRCKASALLAWRHLGESSEVGHRGDEHADELKIAVDSQERREMEVKAAVGHSRIRERLFTLRSHCRTMTMGSMKTCNSFLISSGRIKDASHISLPNSF
jgi:hypothetical protein